MDPGQFSLLDYIFFVIVIVVSSSIGLYYAIKLRKTVTTVDDYLLGGRNMRLLPVACSLAATSLTAMASVGVIAEIYAYGTYVWIVSYGVVVMGIFLSWIFLPIFSELKLTSVFKYFELRFNRRVRLLASGLFLLSGLMYLSVTVYVPALTFQRVTGINTYVSVIVLSLICAIYTAIGGLRAVIWTDVVQLVFMFGSIVVIIFVGVNSANGFDNVIEAARQGGRLYFVNYKSINARSSIWSHAFSTVFLMIYQYGLSQTNIQRFMSFPNLKKMRISVWILVAVFSLYNFLIVILGIVLYANYESCDPYRAGFIKRIDHILPHFIQEKASLFLGFNGIFIAGIFSASLSTTSSYLNAMSGIIYEDFISPMYPGMKGNMAGRIMKTTVFILAVIQIGLVFFIEKMGSITQIVSQCMSLNACTMITLFTLGVFIPKANSKGAQVGALTAIASILILIIGSINAKREPPLPLRIDGCDEIIQENVFNSTQSRISNINSKQDDLHWIFRISFNYYVLIGLLLGLCAGYIVSFLTGGNVIKDQRVLAQFLRKKVLPEEEMKLKSEKNQELE